MNNFMWTEDLVRKLRVWFEATLSREDLEFLIREDDSLRVWWKPEPKDLRLDLLFDVILGGEDHLALLSFIQYARTKPDAPLLPLEVDLELTQQLMRIARVSRTSVRDAEFQAFMSYSHRDIERARIILSVLTRAGLRVFHDVEHIQPGDSIVGRLHEIMSQAPRAILLISEYYLTSDWARRELDLLVARHRSGDLMLFPILLDDVPLPEEVADIFTVDLRGFRTENDRAWAEQRLERLTAACLQKD